MIRARAIKLANEFSTGEFVNWKTYVDLGFRGAELILDGVGAFTKSGVLKSLQMKTYNESISIKEGGKIITKSKGWKE